ncbi:outer membrane protein assembly factor BamE [Cereibacter azotoformans]|uniref:Beta-barrel assembly machine subunit BamE n=2 Tax=Cereibacter TaxID=1653176 RepID=A0A2T5KBB8_9RHOB|nr:outer membrane protein assembly factor BamE [Cereibacter azotoformans]AXQ93823.1 outer membrane protein assembly factor BamE [Cereibacter sphaeroides]MBO4168374.1 outer membrane protein assembly factor BamE [Cereibacter azotoformans]PTR19689.1 Beta-barrel assembly machine subunit BamE [Cereibacter azotoformans]UIJ29337.1 outer membrane protein assembly factor BamE [Cereibacter azotoformans]ULB10045.1 outer membrane protein assembly factor BamE [Cereibacter azotoformans]
MAREGRIGARLDRRGLRRMALALSLGLAVGACQPIYRNHGYVPTEIDLRQIEVGRDTRDTVAEIVGRPSASTLLNDSGWYYVQSRYRHYGAREPQEVDREVVAITFSEAGTVRNIERFGLEKGQIVPLSRRVTESTIQGTGFLRQLFGNIGALRTEDLIE